jgi:hypothetical protein
MVQRRQRERSLFEVLLPDGHKLWPDWLRKIDTVLEDEAVIDVVVQALEVRWPQSRRRGRPGTPAEVVMGLTPDQVSILSAILIDQPLGRSVRKTDVRPILERVSVSTGTRLAPCVRTFEHISLFRSRSPRCPQKVPLAR